MPKKARTKPRVKAEQTAAKSEPQAKAEDAGGFESRIAPPPGEAVQMSGHNSGGFETRVQQDI